MKVRVESFKGKDVKWVEMPDSGVLFNTKDILDVIGGIERPESGEISESCIDLACAVLISTKNREDFAEWLMVRFSGYDKKVFGRPEGLDDEWSQIL